MLKVVFFGLQYYLQAHLMENAGETFFSVNRGKICDRYQRRLSNYFGPEPAAVIGTQHISDLHDLGYLPLEFYAMPEGTLCEMRSAMFTSENTNDNFGWLPNYLESPESSYMFLPCTTATQAHFFREELDMWCELTGGDPGKVPFQGHDFSFRGIADPMAGAISGAAHLLSFLGSDTVPAISLLEDYYDAPTDGSYLVGASVPASEHSVICAGGEANELGTINHILDVVPTGIVSNVSDTWDYFNTINVFLRLPQVRSRIMERPGVYVVRPDSGDPINIICGDSNAPAGSPEHLGTLSILGDIFGWTENAQGYKILNPHIGVIYGDGMSNKITHDMLTRMRDQGWASTNVVFGVGSFRYQMVTRDTFGFAVKATDSVINGLEYMLEKDPKTDYVNGVSIKKSALGRMIILEDGTMVDGMNHEEWEAANAAGKNKMQKVWADGNFVRRTNLQEVRQTLGHLA